MTTPKTIDLNAFLDYLHAKNQNLLSLCGEMNALEACSRMMVLEEFSKWRKEQDTIAAANPAITCPEPHDNA
jgi:hypothetical protein